MHLQPRGGSSILFHSKWPHIWAQADRFGLIIEFLRRLIVIFACGMNTSQSVIGKDRSVLLIPNMS